MSSGNCLVVPIGSAIATLHDVPTVAESEALRVGLPARVGGPLDDQEFGSACLDVREQQEQAVFGRVLQRERRGGLPGVDLDLAGLRREHEDRAHWLAKNLDRTPKTDWHAVRHGADRLLSEPHRASHPTA